jgi:hypothetical protein
MLIRLHLPFSLPYSVLAVQESEAQLQREHLQMQAESRREAKRIREGAEAELNEAQKTHEVEGDRLRREAHVRHKQLEQQTRLCTIAEEDLKESRVEAVQASEAGAHLKLENNELRHQREASSLQVSELQEHLSGKQAEVAKLLSDVGRKNKRVAQLEGAHDEKDKLLAEVRHKSSRLQASIRAHTEREVDLLQALRRSMQAASGRLNSATAAAGGGGVGGVGGAGGVGGVEDSLHLGPGSPGSPGSHGLPQMPQVLDMSPDVVGMGHAVGSSTHRRLSLPALQEECDVLWADVPGALELLLRETQSQHSRAEGLLSDLRVSRTQSASLNSQLASQVKTTCITIIDTIILINYTNDAYI